MVVIVVEKNSQRRTKAQQFDNKSVCDFSIECPDRDRLDFERTLSVVGCVLLLRCPCCVCGAWRTLRLRQAAVFARFAHRFDVSVRGFHCLRRASVFVYKINKTWIKLVTNYHIFITFVLYSGSINAIL